MGSDREREMHAVVAVHVEPIGIDEPAGISVRRGEHRADQRALRELHPVEHDGPRGLSRRGPDGTAPPQRLLDGPLHERAIPRYLHELLGVRAEGPDREGDQVAGLLKPAGEHQLRVRDDLRSAHAVHVCIVMEHP